MDSFLDQSMNELGLKVPSK